MSAAHAFCGGALLVSCVVNLFGVHRTAQNGHGGGAMWAAFYVAAMLCGGGAAVVLLS